jgi:hypothetical protein
MSKFSFIGAAYEAESLNIDAQVCQNLYVEKDEATGQVALLGTPGIHTFTTLPTAPVRGLWAGEDVLYAVGGTKLYRVGIGGGATDIGAGSSPSDLDDDATHSPVTIHPAGSGAQIFINSAGRSYFHNGVNLFIAPVPADSRVTEPTAPASQVGTSQTHAFMDGSFYAGKYGTNRVFYSELNDANTWSDDWYFLKEGYPDAVQAIMADKSELWVFGTHHSTEVWRNEPDPAEGVAIRRDPGAQLQLALAARFSLVNFEGPAFLGTDVRGQVSAYRVQGFTPIRVSTHAVENEWRNYPTVADAIGWVQLDKGHLFWWLTFPSGNATWVYDKATGLWHQRGYWNGSTLERHRARCGCFVYNKFLVGDHTSGKIYEMSRSFFDDDGAPIRRVRSAPHINEERKRLFYHRLQIDLEVTTGKAPDVMIDWTNDGGYTWSNPRVIEPSLAARRGRVIANRLGSSRIRAFRSTITSANERVAIVDAYLNATPGLQ